MLAGMSMWLQTVVETPAGRKTFIVREHAGPFFTDEDIEAAYRPEAGDEFPAEDWGHNLGGPYRDVVLRRTPHGWVETPAI